MLTRAGHQVGVVVCIGDNHGGGDGKSLFFYEVNVELDKQITLPDAVTACHMGLEALAVQLDSVKANVDKDFGTLVTLEANGVQGFKEHHYLSVTGSVELALGRFYNHALAHAAAGKGRVGAGRQGLHLAPKGAYEFKGSSGLGIFLGRSRFLFLCLCLVLKAQHLYQGKGTNQGNGSTQGGTGERAGIRRIIGIGHGKQAGQPCKGIVESPEEGSHQRADGGSHAGTDKGLLQGQGDTVNGRLGDAEKPRKPGRHGHALSLPALALEPDTEDGTNLGADGNAAESLEGGEAGHLEFRQENRHESPVDAEDNEDLPEGTENHGAEPGYIGIESLEEGRQAMCHGRSDGAYHQEGSRHHDKIAAKGHEDGLEDFRQMSLEEALHIHQESQHNDGRQHRGGVGGLSQGQHQEGKGLPCGYASRNLPPGGIHQGAAAQNCQQGINLEVFGACQGNKHGQVSEGCPGHIGQHLESGVFHNIRGQGCGYDEGTLQKTAGSQHIDYGRNAAGNGTYNGCHQAFLRTGIGAGIQVQLLCHHCKDIRDMGADNHLELAAAFHNGDDPRHGADFLPSSLGRFLQGQPQAGSAMGSAGHIIPATHSRDDIAGQLLIISDFWRHATIFLSHKRIIPFDSWQYSTGPLLIQSV